MVALDKIQNWDENQSVMLNFNVEKINKIIEPMSRRIDMVIQGNGCKIKY